MSINSLNQSQFSRIFYYLQDSDLKVFGETCKKMHTLAAEELKKRDLHIEQLLLPSIKYPSTSGFVVTRKFNIQYISEARLFPIGDKHKDEDCARDRSALIGFLSRRAPVILLIETVTSMERIANIFQPQFVRYPDGSTATHAWIKSLPEEPAYKANTHALGWDTRTDRDPMLPLLGKQRELLSYKELIKETYRIVFQIQATELSAQLPEELSIPHLWKEEKLDEFLKEDQVLDFIKNPANLDESTLLGHMFINYFFPRFSEKVSNYVNSNLEEIKANREELFWAYENYQRQLSFCQRETKRIEQDYEELRRKTSECTQQTFSNRTDSMTSTLQKVDAYCLTLGIREHYVVVLAGAEHLEARVKGDEFDLSPLYEELKNHKAAILLPNVVTQYYEGRPWSKDTGIQ